MKKIVLLLFTLCLSAEAEGSGENKWEKMSDTMKMFFVAGYVGGYHGGMYHQAPLSLIELHKVISEIIIKQAKSHYT